MHAVLPSKYYLSHALELFAQLRQHSFKLLSDDDVSLLGRFESLEEDAQCLLVRCLARKPRFLRINTLVYEELNNPTSALQQLLENQLLAHPNSHEWQEFLSVLTKQDLLGLLHVLNVGAKTSMNKATLLQIAQRHSEASNPAADHVFQKFVHLPQQQQWNYFFFLFFGNLRNQFQKFVMRDLGLLKTRGADKQVARFHSQLEARGAYELHNWYKKAKTHPQQVAEQYGDYLLDEANFSEASLALRDKLLLQLGDAYRDSELTLAERYWRASQAPEAQERWVRHQYKHGDRTALLTDLKSLLAEQPSIQSQLFLEDFISRKYHGKRTSVYTDILREPDVQWQLDEAFINDVERGVQYHHERSGRRAFFTENEFWRALFAVCFWELLFESEQFTEFDRLPAPLRSRLFYQRHKVEIESALQQFEHGKQLLLKFMRICSQHYGKPNGLFRWRRQLVDHMAAALSSSDCSHLAPVINDMARNYQHAKDGFPDLLVCEGEKIWFEEVKAPGDCLRPNQLVAIQRLRRSGLRVDVSQVSWSTNPQQAYAVVDIETTGGRRGGNAITEIAVVTVRNQQVEKEWSTLLNPCRPIPRHITQLTGIDNAMVANAPVFADIADRLAQELDNAIFVAHNVGFDYGFIKAAYESLGRRFRMPKYCTVRNARKTFPGLNSYSLGSLTNHFDIELDGHHRALNDARATADLLRLIQDQTSPTTHQIPTTRAAGHALKR